MSRSTMVQVTLEGFAVNGRRLKRGSKIPLRDLPDDLRAQVQGDIHPFLEIVKTHRKGPIQQQSRS